MATVTPITLPAESVVVIDVEFVADWLKQRPEWGVDGRDEVWDGVYVVAPIASISHQGMISDFLSCLMESQEFRGAKVYPGLNVTDRKDDWTKNYRCPDVIVKFPGCKAILTDSTIIGGPDFIIEVLSKNDLAPQKLDFYAKVGTRECLYIDLATRASEVYRLNANEMSLVGKSTIDSPAVLVSEVLELSFQAVTEQNEAKVLITNLKNPTQKWFA